MSTIEKNYSAIKNHLQRPLECPFTLGVPMDPVIDPHGHTFGKEAILLTQQKVDGKDCVKCPYTEQFIPVDQLYPNKDVEQVANEIKEFTKALKVLNQSDSQNFAQEEIIEYYKGKIVELTITHNLDLKTLSELRLADQQKDDQIQTLQQTLRKRDELIKELQTQCEELKKDHKVLNERIVKLESEYTEQMKSTVASFQNTLVQVTEELKNKKLDNTELSNKSNENEEIIVWLESCCVISLAVAGIAIMKLFNQ